MNISQLLEEAWSAVEQAEIPEELRPVAFSKAIELAAKGGKEALSPSPPLPRSDGFGGAGQQGGDAAGAMAEALQVERDRIREVYQFTPSGDIEVIVGTPALDDSNAGAVRQLALLVAGASQLGLGKEWTPSQEIRDHAEHFGKADYNFATYLKNMTTEFSFSGKGVGREVKLRKPGQERLRDLILQLTGSATREA